MLQCLVLSSLVNDHISSTLLHLLLDEAKEVFLVHTRGSVDVSIHLVKWGREEGMGGEREGEGREREGEGRSRRKEGQTEGEEGNRGGA